MNTSIILISPLPAPALKAYAKVDRIEDAPWWSVRTPFLVVLVGLVIVLAGVLTSPQIVDSVAISIAEMLR